MNKHLWLESIFDIDLLLKQLIPATWVPALTDSMNSSHFGNFEKIEEKKKNPGYDPSTMSNKSCLKISRIQISVTIYEIFELLWQYMFAGIATEDKKTSFSAITTAINPLLSVFPEGNDTHSVTLVCAVALF